MMHMTFYWSKEVTLLVDTWHTSTWLSYSLTLLACLLSSSFYQYIENLRLRLKVLSSSTNTTTTATSPPSITDPLLQTKPSGGKFSLTRVAGAVLFGINSGIGYLLMLAVMSFNGGVFLAVVLGLAIGYLVFRGGNEDLVLADNPCACA